MSRSVVVAGCGQMLCSPALGYPRAAAALNQIEVGMGVLQVRQSTVVHYIAKNSNKNYHIDAAEYISTVTALALRLAMST